MAKISQLPSAGALTGTEQVPINQSGTTVQVLLSTIRTWVASTISGFASSGANSDITSLSGLTTPLSLSQGGTAATSASAARTSLGLAIGTNVQAYNANTALTNAVQSFSVAQRGTITALTDGTTITPDFAVANNFSVTLGGNRTLANPTNLVAGQSGVIKITQDGTGSRTLAFGSYWDWAGGTAPSLTTTASAVDILAYYVDSTTNITARLIGDRK